MSLSMYQASVPVFLRTLGALSGVVDKGSAFLNARKIDHAVIMQYRLYPDMLPFQFQIRQMTVHSAGCTARLAGVEPLKWEDTETNLDDLKARITKAQDFIKSIDAAKIDGSEDRDITLTMRGNAVHFKGQAYLLHFVFPNFFFHATTGYDILRHIGVDVGKSDFIG